MRTALLVIDPQRIYTDSTSEMFCADSAATIARINSLMDAAASRRQLTVLVRHVHKRDGSDLGHLFDFTGEADDDFNFKEGSSEVEYDGRLTVPASAVQITKNRYSAFAGTRLAETLQMHGIEKLVMSSFTG